MTRGEVYSWGGRGTQTGWDDHWGMVANGGDGDNLNGSSKHLIRNNADGINTKKTIFPPCNEKQRKQFSHSFSAL